MGEPQLILHFRTEAELVDFAADFAARLRAADCGRLLVGLRGELGAGKTTWMRGALRGLGYTGRVPSPTYTLLEQYALPGLSVVHLDLYRLGREAELDNLGVRDWLANERTWVVVEWPERAPRLAAACDVELSFSERGGDTERTVAIAARTHAGIHALRHGCQQSFNYEL
jgi:tRNA threonylcarbamoyladenosine biosynthesis protein TsaE